MIIFMNISNWIGNLIISHFSSISNSPFDISSDDARILDIWMPKIRKGLRWSPLQAALDRPISLLIHRIRGIPSMGVRVPQNGWFIREHPTIKWMIEGYPHFRKAPYWVATCTANSMFMYVCILCVLYYIPIHASKNANKYTFNTGM